MFVCTVVESKVKILQNFVALSEYMNFIVQERGTFKISNDVLDLSFKWEIPIFFQEFVEPFIEIHRKGDGEIYDPMSLSKIANRLR